MNKKAMSVITATAIAISATPMAFDCLIKFTTIIGKINI